MEVNWGKPMGACPSPREHGQGFRWDLSSGREREMKELPYTHSLYVRLQAQPGVLGFRHPAEGLREGCGLQLSPSHWKEALSTLSGPADCHSWYPLNAKGSGVGGAREELSL